MSAPNFQPARQLAQQHIAVLPADQLLDPPESYYAIQDILVFTSALSWALAYLFYTFRAVRDQRTSMAPFIFPLNLSWELVFWVRVASTSFEYFAFSGWFVADLGFTMLAIRHALPSGASLQIGVATAVLVVPFWLLTDEQWGWNDYQMLGWYAGNSIMVLISWGSILDLWYEGRLWGGKGGRRGRKLGHSLEIWTMRFLGTNIFGFAVFFWRYTNAPQNWAYVVNGPSLFLILASTIADLAYPAIYTSQSDDNNKSSLTKKSR